MKKLYLKIFSIPFVYFFGAIIIEIITFLTLGFGFLPKYFLLDISIILILTSIVFIVLNNISQMIISIVFLGLQLVLGFINVTLYKVYGDLMSLDMMFLGGEAFKAFHISFLNWWYIIGLLIVFAICITLFSLSLKNKAKTKVNYKSYTGGIILAVFLVMASLGGSTYGLQVNNLYCNTETLYDEYFNNDGNLHKSLFIKNDSYKKFGTFGFYTKNLGNMIFKTKFTLKDMNDSAEYIKSAPITQKNEKSGLLANDNLIVIMMESLEWFGIDPIFTPFLYEFVNDSYQFNNFYSKNKTNFTEINVILGNSPTENGFTTGYSNSTSKLLNNIMPTTLPYKLRSDGGFEVANYFHNYEGSFYGRNKSHTKFGFDNFYGMEDMILSDKNPSFGNFPKDSEMFEFNMDKIAPLNKKFMSYITTVTTHGPYVKNEKYKDFYDELENPIKLEAYKDYLTKETSYIYPTKQSEIDIFNSYKAAVMDLELGIKYMVDYLKENNMYDKTSIVLFSDHYAYYDDLCYNIKGIDKKEYYNTESYRVPFFIKSNKLESFVDDTFTCSYNILPTILDLVGVEYNQNMYMGYSAFDKLVDKTIFVSAIGGIMTDKLYSDDANIIYSFDNTITEEDINYFKQNTLEFYVKLDYINKIYNTDIFRYLPETIEYV